MHAQTVDTKWCGGSFHVMVGWAACLECVAAGMCFIVLNILTVYILVIEVDIGPAGSKAMVRVY